MPVFSTRVVYGGAKQWAELFDANSPEFNRGRQSFRSQRKFILDYSDLNAFNAECFPDANGLPGRHPNLSDLWVDSWAASPMVGDDPIEYVDGLATPLKYTATVTYTPLDLQNEQTQDFESDPSEPIDLLVANMSFRTEAMTLPGESFKWESDSSAADEDINPVMMIQLVDFSLQRPRAARIPFTAIRNCVGKVNESRFFGADAETVLYMGAQIGYRFSSNGQRSYEIQHQFTEKRIDIGGGTIGGWNYFLRPDGTWDKLLNKTNDETVYKTTDQFRFLLRP